jgi:hypothetical protein
MAPKAKQSKAAGPELARGIGREGRSKTYKRRGLWAIKKKNGGKFPVHEKKQKTAEPEAKVLARGCIMRNSLALEIVSCPHQLLNTYRMTGHCLDVTVA